MTLGQEFFARPAETVARELIGTTLQTSLGQKCRIVETEAYVGPHDLASHSRAGNTPRTQVMFGPAGHVYVYLIYGQHHMLNIVTGEEGHGEAVLIRAAEPIGFHGRLDGPGRLTRTLGIRVDSDNGRPLGDRIWFEAGTPPARIERTRRIGVEYAGEWSAALLRFIDPDSHHLSR